MKPVIIAIGIFLAILAGAFALRRIDYSWANWKPATCMPEHCFCEAIRPGVIAQPANTWSSFSFVWLGLLILNRRKHELASFSKPRNPIIPQSAFSNIYGLALMLIGLGSAFYHASLTLVGQFFDVMGMYLLASFVLLYNFSKIFPLVRKMFAVAYPLLNIALAVALLGLPHWRRYLFASIVLAALLPEYFLRQKNRALTNGRFLLGAMVSLLIAFVIWTLDINGIFCQPESWLQGHALWHILGAVAAGLLYEHYCAERFSTTAG